MFLKNKNIIFKIRRSKVTDYAALRAEIVNSSIFVPIKQREHDHDIPNHYQKDETN